LASASLGQTPQPPSALGKTCRHPQVKGLTVMVNSIYNGYRYEDLWLDN